MKTQVNPFVAAVVIILVVAVVGYFFFARSGPPKATGDEGGGGLSSLGKHLDPNAVLQLSEEDKRKFREQMEEARRQRLARPD